MSKYKQGEAEAMADSSNHVNIASFFHSFNHLLEKVGVAIFAHIQNLLISKSFKNV